MAGCDRASTEFPAYTRYMPSRVAFAAFHIFFFAAFDIEALASTSHASWIFGIAPIGRMGGSVAHLARFVDLFGSVQLDVLCPLLSQL